jgi:hypothetical protein
VAVALAEIAAAGVDVEAVRAKMRALLVREGVLEPEAVLRRRRMVLTVGLVLAGAAALAVAVASCVR